MILFLGSLFGQVNFIKDLDITGKNSLYICIEISLEKKLIIQDIYSCYFLCELLSFPIKKIVWTNSILDMCFNMMVDTWKISYICDLGLPFALKLTYVIGELILELCFGN